MKTDYTPVEVVWRDAHADFSGSWVSREAINTEPCLVITVGFLVPNAKPGHTTVAQSVLGNDMMDSVLHIPDGMVESVTNL